MGHAFELFFQVIFEVVAYGVGRAVLLVFAPHCGVETQTDPPRKPWAWHGFSFVKNGKRYFYFESVQVIGLGVMLAFILLIVLANTYLK